MAQRGRPRSPSLLTPREQEVLDLIRAGRTNAEIGEALGITVETVKQHVSQVLDKLGVTTREEAAAWREPTHRWWTALPRWALLGAAGAVLVGLAVLALGVWLANGSDDPPDNVLRTTTRSPSATESPAPTATPTRTQPPPAAAASYPLGMDGPAYVAVRGQLSPRSGGTLVIALADGSGEWTLVSDRIVAEVAGVIGSAAAPDAIFFVRLDSERGRTLARLDLANGEVTTVASWTALPEWLTDAALSPDGTEVAYSDTSGIQLLDIPSGTVTQLLASGSYDLCNGNPPMISECHNYAEPQWSPDGRWLFVDEVFYEGGRQLRLDRDDAWASSILSGEDGNTPSRGVTSPFSDAVCAHGQYINASPLYVARAPDWRLRKYLPELDTGTSGPSVIDCDWIDDSTLAVLVWVRLGEAELRVVDLDTEEVRTVTTFTANLDSWQVRPGPSPETVTVDFTWDDQYGDPTALPYGPEIVDLETGERTPILAPGDRVSAVLR